MGTGIMQRFTLVRMSKFCGIKLKKSKLINEVGALSTTLPSSNQSALTGTKDTKLFSIFLYSAAACCLSILWHKIQSRSFSHAHTSNLPANRSRAINEVVKCFFMGKGKSGLQKTKLIDYLNQPAPGFTTTGDGPIPSSAGTKDTKLFLFSSTRQLQAAVPFCGTKFKPAHHSFPQVFLS